MSRAESLYRLQLLDTELDASRNRLRDIDADLSGSPALAHTRAEMANAERVLRAASSELRSLELDAQALDDKIKEDEARLYAGTIRSPKEMLDVQREVASLKKRRETLDDEMLAAMERVEQSTSDAAHCRAAVAQAEARFADDSLHLREERGRLLATIEGDLERRQALSLSVPAQDLDLFLTIQSRKPNHIAVTLLRSGACTQCGEMASSQLLQLARTGSTLAICSNCGRILYAQ
jgi:predicted  nucleic acid-binding Zn-ribbon protein